MAGILYVKLVSAQSTRLVDVSNSAVRSKMGWLVTDITNLYLFVLPHSHAGEKGIVITGFHSTGGVVLVAVFVLTGGIGGKLAIAVQNVTRYMISVRILS